MGKTSESDAGQKRPRQRNVIWDALAEIFEYEPLTRSEIKLWGKLTASFRDAGATKETLFFAYKEFKKEFPNASITPTALEKHYSRYVARKPKPRVLCPACGLGGGFHVTDCAHSEARTEARASEAYKPLSNPL